jgi:L-lactate dehydrogenase complex protein LldG
MSDSRRRILTAVRRALGRRNAVEPGRPDIPPEPPRPVWTGDRIERFLTQLDKVAGSYTRLDRMDAVPQAALDFLVQLGDDRRLLVAPDEALRALTWPEALQRTEDPAQSRHHAAALITAAFGVAETGSLVLPSAAHRPPSMQLLPDHLLVVLRADDVVDYMEEVWARLAELPRTVTFMTGPSRTADVEQTIQIGAHGPRRLHVLLVANQGQKET